MVKDWLDWLKTIQPKHHEWCVPIVSASHEVMSGSFQPHGL